jgi:hypothetical protein
MSQINYTNKYISNKMLEWLIEEGKVNDSVFFKGETGDRYSIYVFTKMNKNTVNIYCIWNQYSHGTDKGTHLGTIKDYIFTVKGAKSYSWDSDAGNAVKQLKRQGVSPIKNKYTIRYCRSSYFMKTIDGNEFAPWIGMKIDLKTGLLVNKPSRKAKIAYSTAKATDKTQRKLNYIANRENTKALERYRKAGGDTELARGWRPDALAIEENLAKIDWSIIPKDDVFRHRNATIRSNIIEHYGMNAIIEDLDYEVVDEDTIDGRYYKLLDVVIPDFSNSIRNGQTYKGLYLEMINPSTGESHFEGVANVSDWNGLKEATVKAALTWRDNDLNIQTKGDWMHRSGHSSDDYVIPEVLK